MKRIAVFGYNRLSFEALSRLDKELYQIVVIDQNPAKAALAREKWFRNGGHRFSQR